MRSPSADRRPARSPLLRAGALAAIGLGRPGPSDTDAVRPLIAAHRRVFPGADADLLRRAYAVADHWHAGQTRKSGAPYVTHPLAVAILLAEIGMDTTTLVAALLHDTVEDTGLTIGEVKAEFGAEVAVLVDGVTKLDGSRWGDHAEAETFKKMIVAASIDLRVLVIKLADRVHNLRTLAPTPGGRSASGSPGPRWSSWSRSLTARALRLPAGDGGPVVRQPRAGGVRAGQGAGPGDLRRQGRVPGRRGGGRARGTGGGRPAGHGRSAGASPVLDPPGPARRGQARPTDTARVVVVVDGTEADCYVALGALHGRWRPIEQRFRDYICMPKYNMYRSLHTAVLVGGRDGEGGDLVGVLIRTPAMDRIASYGVAARIREAGGKDGKVTADMARQADLDWLDRLLAWQPLAEAADFLDGLRADLSHGGIVVFTPAGDPVKLPTGSTAVDFAYAVSPATAGASVGVLVNGARKAMENRLAHGQVVDLIAGPYADPPDSWLAAARSGQARTHLKAAIARREAEDAAAAGRIQVARAVAADGDSLRDLEDDGTAFSAARRLGRPDLDALYEAVGRGDLTPDEFLAALALEPADAAGPPVVLP